MKGNHLGQDASYQTHGVAPADQDKEFDVSETHMLECYQFPAYNSQLCHFFNLHCFSPLPADPLIGVTTGGTWGVGHSVVH